jgi:hypothetical protein
LSKRVIITQSNYIPWKGYFDAIASCDYFVILDDVQYTRRDWRNRNIIKNNTIEKWLSIPVQAKGKYLQKINETVIADSTWNQKHLNTLNNFYAASPNYNQVCDWVNSLYTNCTFSKLSEVNEYFLRAIMKFLAISTQILPIQNFKTSPDKNLRLLEICKDLKATEYVSGPAASSYLSKSLFETNGIKIVYNNYDDYKPYPQLGNNFNHNVSILDLIYNTGFQAPLYLKNIK